jgi:hypothetical protein
MALAPVAGSPPSSPNASQRPVNKLTPVVKKQSAPASPDPNIMGTALPNDSFLSSFHSPSPSLWTLTPSPGPNSPAMRRDISGLSLDSNTLQPGQPADPA